MHYVIHRTRVHNNYIALPSEEDRATTAGNMYRKSDEIWTFYTVYEIRELIAIIRTPIYMAKYKMHSIPTQIMVALCVYITAEFNCRVYKRHAFDSSELLPTFCLLCILWLSMRRKC